MTLYILLKVTSFMNVPIKNNSGYFLKHIFQLVVVKFNFLLADIIFLDLFWQAAINFWTVKFYKSIMSFGSICPQYNKNFDKYITQKISDCDQGIRLRN